MTARLNKTGPVKFRGEVVAANGMTAKLNMAAIDMFETTYDYSFNILKVSMFNGSARYSTQIDLLHCCLVHGGNPDVTREDAANLLSDDSEILFELLILADPHLRERYEATEKAAEAKSADTAKETTTKKK